MKSIVLLIGFFSMIHFLAFAETKVEPPAPLSDSEPVIAVENSNQLLPVAESEDIPDPFNNGAENPFEETMPLGGMTPSGPEPVLQGLAIGPQKSTAVINGKTYVQGAEARDGIELVEVRKKEADITLGGISKTLRLMPELKGLKKQDTVLSRTNNAETSESIPAIFEEANALISEEEPLEKTEPLPDSLMRLKKESE